MLVTNSDMYESKEYIFYNLYLTKVPIYQAAINETVIVRNQLKSVFSFKQYNNKYKLSFNIIINY